ncbi:Eco29kI family restriction endonuclease [Caulobacter sp.]|uniref:Eco29kI family restriction endonuclease n=1 Tax=Caulobacter sp. TaxID=78 RepID=UPI002B491A85|nr:Eco29kI family restriction endonuclease [Caulobacter sp.]HJV43455.1 Eco29kI family restriction endonuclease [Caulobacter sp.]
MSVAYNPLATINLARSIQNAILEQPLRPLGSLANEQGAGVYAIYYGGDFPAYSALAASMRSEDQIPIYVGKAIPKGGRIGGLTRDAELGRQLGRRLNIHAESIRQASNLDIEHFYARSLIIEDVWISLGENMLIQQFRPVWNVVTAGFGNQAPGRGRQDQAMSLWDTLHPGRAHSRMLGPNKTPVEEIASRVVAFLSGRTVPLDIENTDGEDEAE